MLREQQHERLTRSCSLRRGPRLSLLCAATIAGVLTSVMLSTTPVTAAGAGTISTFAGGNAVGDGNAATAGALNSPLSVAVDAANNLYIADKANHRVRKVVPGTDGIIGKTNSSGQNVDTDDIITTVAGNGTSGSTGDGQPATSAELVYPQAVTVDASGNLYVVDEGANRVRFVCLQATSCSLPANAGGPSVASGAITTVAGNGSNTEGGNGGAAKAAGLSGPVAIAFDGTGNVFITDSYFNTVRFVCLQSSTCTNAAWYGTVASGDIAPAAATPSFGGDSGDGGPATSALLNIPDGITVDASGNLYIAESSGNTTTHGTPLRKVTASTGIISTLSTGPSNTFEGAGLQFSSSGGTARLYVSNIGDEDVLSLNLSTLAYTTVAGTGSGTCGFAGDGGPATSASLCQPSGIDVTPAGELFIPDPHFLRVRKVNTSAVIVTVAGDGQTVATGDGGPATSGGLSAPWGVAIDGSGDVFIADSNDNRVRLVCGKSGGCTLPTGTVAQGTIATVAGNGTNASGPGGDGGDGGPATSAETYVPGGVALDRSGNLYVADYYGGRVRFVCMQTAACTLPAGSGGPTVSPGNITTIAGTGIVGNGGDGGPAAQATIADPIGLAVDGAGNVYVADPANQDVRFVCVQATACTLPGGAGGQVPSGDIITLAGTPRTGGFSGDGGPAAGARLLGPDGVALDSAGNLYIADSANNRVRFTCLQATLCGTPAGFVPTGFITTIAGTGASGFGGDGGLATSATMNGPDGVGLDGAGNLYVADAGNNRLRLICMQATCPDYLSSGGILQGDITTLAGNGTAGGTGDGGLANAAELNVPRGLALDRANTLYVADGNNDRVRQVSAPVTLQPYPTPLFPSFANQQVGTSSSAHTVTLSNPTAASVTVSSVALSGSNASDFSVVGGGDHCTSQVVAAGGSCTVQVGFTPTGFGRRQATLTFSDSGGPTTTQTSGLVGLADSTKVGVVGSDSALYTKQDAQAYVDLGGVLTAPPAMVSVPGAAGTAPMALYIVVGSDHSLYVRSDTQNWQFLSTVGVSCLDTAGAAVTPASGGGSTLTVACQGSDHGLYFAQTPVTAGTLPAVSSWTGLGGMLTAGPQVTYLGNTVVFIVEGGGGQLYQTTTGGGYTMVNGSCIAHPATASNGTTAYLACHGQDGALYYASNTGSGWSGFTDLGGVVLDAPGLALTTGQLTFYVEGSDHALYHRVLPVGGTMPGPFVDDGGVLTFGPGAAGMLAS